MPSKPPPMYPPRTPGSLFKDIAIFLTICAVAVLFAFYFATRLSDAADRHFRARPAAYQE